jgi:hypothetical protein
MSTASDSSRAERGPAHCPVSGPGDLPNQNRRASSQLVPSGARSVLICRYAQVLRGGIPGGHQLTEAEVTSASKRASLRNSLLALPKAPDGDYSCPETPTALRYLLVWAYDDAPPVYVRILFAGCESVRNEVDPQVYSPIPALRHELSQLLAE